MENDISLEYLKRIIEGNIEAADCERVSRIKCRLSISSGLGKICYCSLKLCNDRDV